MAQEHAGTALNWYHLPRALVEADVVVSATGAPHVVIQESDVKTALEERGDRPLYIVDIAVPRDVEESVGNLPDVYLYDIDQLQTVVDANLFQRQAAVPYVEEIVSQESTRFGEWVQSRQVLPVLVDLRSKTQEIASSELLRYESRLGEMDIEDKELVTYIVHRIVNKILHEPTVRLKAAAAEGNGFESAQALRDLFALETASGTSSLKVTESLRASNGQTGISRDGSGLSAKLPKDENSA